MESQSTIYRLVEESADAKVVRENERPFDLEQHLYKGYYIESEDVVICDFGQVGFAYTDLNGARVECRRIGASSWKYELFVRHNENLAHKAARQRALNKLYGVKEDPNPALNTLWKRLGWLIFGK